MLSEIIFVAIGIIGLVSESVEYTYRSYQDPSQDVYRYNDYYEDYEGDYQYNDNDYSPSRSGHKDQGYSYRQHSMPSMEQYKKSYQPQPQKVFVPVVIKKKSTKKRKIISVHNGFYIPGGMQMFGKFKDLYSCKKACEITPTCFSGDFNPWLGKCYLHSSITACANMKSHNAITHFKKVPCSILESPRSYIVLGVNVINGIEIPGIKSLSDCIKKCATAGGGIASMDTNIVKEGQVCCHLDYDFSSHKCFFHPCVSMAIARAQFCWAQDILTDPPLNSVAHPTTVSITICPRSKL